MKSIIFWRMTCESSKFLVKRLSAQALLPTRGSSGAAGYDICSIEEVLVPARGKAKIPTGLSWLVPKDTYARIAPRSGLAWKNSIDVGAGVIDRDYTGHVFVILYNHSDQQFLIKKHDRVAQVIIQKIEPTTVQEVENLEQTERGMLGFGSTGIQAITGNLPA